MLVPIRDVCLILLLAAASVWDCRQRRIPNALNLAGALAAMLLSFPGLADTPQLRAAFLGLALATLVMLALYLSGGVGGGDVKLAVGFGGLAGYPQVVLYLFYGSLSALALILARLTWRGELWRGLRQALLGRRKAAPAPGPGEPDDGPPVAAATDQPPAAQASFALALLLGVLWVWLMRQV